MDKDWDLREFCEHKPYAGASYYCLFDAGHTGFHSDLTIMWNEDGDLVNADGSIICERRR